MQSLKVPLTRAVRYFRRQELGLLVRTDLYLSAGSEVRLGVPVMMQFDQRMHFAAPIMAGIERGFYVIVSEVQQPSLIEKLRRLPIMTVIEK